MAGERSTGDRFMPVHSEMLVAVRYNEDVQQLDVIFRTGDKYRYKRVPPLEFSGLIGAKSHGKYMRKRILGRYDFERLD